jgi:hypothetical protein
MSPVMARACSSDQKKREFRQNASMMLGSFSSLKFTIGTVNMGSAPVLVTCILISLSISIESGSWQWAQTVSTRTDSGLPRRCPCTKGVAKASTAQAPQICFPSGKVIWCGVSAAVTG